MQPPQYGAPPPHYAGQPQFQGQSPGQSPYAQPQPEFRPGQVPIPTKKGFFGGLFDLSFSTFITTSIVKVLYVLWLLASLVVFFGGEIAGIVAITNDNALEGLLMMVGAPIATCVYVVLGRVYLELVIVMFRIAENIGEINSKTR